jgi:hypothetical protein
MKKALTGSITAAWLACGLTAGAQSAPPQSTLPQAAPASAVTVAGCVQAEKSVLQRTAAAGDLGMGDEFVVTHVKLNPAAQPAEPVPDSPIGTSGSAAGFGKVYRVTGDKESELKPYVGQRVEITGAFKNETDAKAELASIGKGDKPGELTPANTPEITITAIKPVPGTCPPVAK